jgi:hypothetical protein
MSRADPDNARQIDDTRRNDPAQGDFARSKRRRGPGNRQFCGFAVKPRRLDATPIQRIPRRT